ncbi:MAG: hypothetical protein FGM54_00935 [Chitinophagaceae bacterium]|nr:hypothetical protein [Chitinophagaceae bacterium]
MKRNGFLLALGILSACCLFLQTASVYRAYELLRHKAHIRSVLQEKESDTILTFSIHEWEMLKHPEPHEVEIQGKRFDIKSLHRDGDVIRVEGFFDYWETAWYERSMREEPQGMHPVWLAFFYMEVPTRFSPLMPLWFNVKKVYPFETFHLCVAPKHQGFKPPEYQV